MNDKLAAMISRVQKLINQADQAEARGQSLSGVTSESDNANEAAAYRAAAERIMREYRIEEEHLIATDQITTGVVMHSIFGLDDRSEFYTSYLVMMRWIADHAEIEMQVRYNRSDEDHGIWFDLFGYEGDLRMAEWLWSSARLVFGSHLEPTVNRAESDQVNAYNLRQSGMLRKDIARALWGDNTPANRSRAQRLYVAECKVRGEQPALSGLGSDAEMYRDAYATGFLNRLCNRLRAARDAADSVGGVTVLHGRSDRIKEALYIAYPNRRPKPRTDVVPVSNTPAKMDRRVKSWTQADERRLRRQTGASAQAGRNAGGVAAGKVEIARNNAPAQRIEE
jgi:hypothetical protein